MSSKKQTKSLAKPQPMAQVAKAPKMRVSEWARMLVTPGESKVVHSPVTAPFTGDSLAFTRTVEFGAADFNNGDFSIIMRPAIQDTLLVQGAAGVPFAIGSFGDGGTSFQISETVIPGFPGARPLQGMLRVTDVGGAFQGLVATVVSDGVACFEWPVPPGNVMPCKVDVNGGQTFRIFSRVAGVWAAGLPLTSAGAPLNVCDAWCIGVDNPYSSAGQSIELSQTGGAATITAPESHYDAFSTHATDLSGVEQMRVSAMSVLVSYSGNQFNNGGVIAAARTRPGYHYPDAPFTSLTELLDHNYSGPLKEGAYVWWRPSSVKEMDFRGVHDRPLHTELRVAGNFADPTGSIKVTLQLVVDFYSRLQLFSRDYFPPLVDAYVSEYHRLESVPAATCNPSHTEIFRKLIRTGGKAAKAGASHLVANPEMIATLLGMLL